MTLASQVNIGTAYLNRGFFKLARQNYEQVLSMDNERKTAIKGRGDNRFRLFYENANVAIFLSAARQ